MQSIGVVGGPFWSNGPSPGQFYQFPATAYGGNQKNDVTKAPGDFGSQRGGGMITVGTSVIGIKYDSGVIIAADNLVSYGSLARYQNMQRVYKINDKVIIGVGGDFADFQFIKRHIDQLVINDESLGDKNELKPKALYTYLTRVFYNRRSKMNPLYLDIVVGGIQDGEPFLGHVNVRGKSYLSNCIGTGFGNHLSIPLFREYVENPNIVIDKPKALELIKKCMEILYYRDCRAYPKFTQGVCESDGVTIHENQDVSQNWQVAHYIKGF